MRAVKEDATDPTETALWEHALSQVCKDECTDLLDMIKKEANHLAEDVQENHVPFAQACAEHVVQHVEAEVLGCCGRSCGFDGRRCLLWPFFSPQEKVDWEVECCAEISILKNSSRELMCNSVLPDRLAKKASNFDLEEQSGTDIGKVLIGQNSSLFWTQTGAQESALGKEVQAHDGDKVSMDFLIKHQKIGEEYLHLGYFRKQPLSKMLNEATSMMEVSSQDDTCNFWHFEEQCPKKFMTTFVKKCNEAWNVAKGFRHLLTHPAIGDCRESDPQNFSTPEECERLEVNSFGTVFLHYFEYNKENKDLPIKCFSVAVSNDLSNGIKKQCKGKDDWWKRIKGKFIVRAEVDEWYERRCQWLRAVGVYQVHENKLRVFLRQHLVQTWAQANWVPMCAAGKRVCSCQCSIALLLSSENCASWELALTSACRFKTPSLLHKPLSCEVSGTWAFLFE